MQEQEGKPYLRIGPLQVGAPPLVWNEDLADLAQEYANWLKNNKQCLLEHSSTLQ